MNSTPAPLAPPAPPAPLAPPARKIGPANPEYDRRVVYIARTLTMDARGRMVERVTESLGPRRSRAQDDRSDGITHRALVAVQ